jgi:hypothetical protein
MRVYVAIPVPFASERFKPSKMMRWDSPAEANGIAVMTSRTFLCAGAIAYRGLFVALMEPLILRVEGPRVRRQLSDIAPQRDFRGQRRADCQELPTLGQERLYRRDDRGGDATM